MANHFSYFWACSKIQSYWHEAAAEIGKILGEEFDFSFIMLYLVKIPKTVLNSDKYLLKILLTSSRKAITCKHKWLQVDPPTEDQWLGIVNEIYCMEITFTVRINLEKCIKYWDKWIVYTYN